MDQIHPIEPSSHWIVRAYYTPVRDALRGELSARLDVRREIAAADLPAPVASLIYCVVRRTRLWRRERLDLVRELVAHFADGLAAGRSPEALVESFGTPREAARLIRRAKRRARPLYWHAWWYLSRGLMAVVGLSIVAYALLAVRFYFAQPTISHNYWEEINAARTVPEDERAWPLYRAALIELGEVDAQLLRQHWPAEPGDSDWDQAVAIARRHSEAIELARQAAHKPHFGYLYGDRADRVAGAEWILSANAPLAEENSHLIGVLLEGPQGLRAICRLLQVDTMRAAADGDGPTVTANLTALVSLARHAPDPPASLVEQLIGYAIFGVAADDARTILARYPELLSDAELRDLAHVFAGFQGGSAEVDWSVERFTFDDALQRVYTDDGSGDGRITDAGVAMGLIDDYFPPGEPPEEIADVVELVGPVAALVGSRRENRELYHAYLDEMIALHQRPPWQWDYVAIDAAQTALDRTTNHGIGRARFGLIRLLLPPVGAVFSAAERVVQERDATLVAIALVLWHRQHGAWPDHLEQLTPALLPEVPRDRYDGQPLRYVLRDGDPILYSLGRDQDDDGGTPTVEEPVIIYEGQSPERAAAADDGDWILWAPAGAPQPEPAKP